MVNKSTTHEIICISEFCNKYKVSNWKREKLGILSNNIQVIEENEYMELFDLINRNREMEGNFLLKRKLEEANYTISRNVKSKLNDNPSNFGNEVAFQYVEDEEIDEDEAPEILLTSDLNGSTQLHNYTIIKYPDIIESEDSCQITQVRQETSPIPNFMILTSDDHQWQSSPFNFF